MQYIRLTQRGFDAWARDVERRKRYEIPGVGMPTREPLETHGPTLDADGVPDGGAWVRLPTRAANYAKLLPGEFVPAAAPAADNDAPTDATGVAPAAAGGKP